MDNVDIQDFSDLKKSLINLVKKVDKIDYERIKQAESLQNRINEVDLNANEIKFSFEIKKVSDFLKVSNRGILIIIVYRLSNKIIFFFQETNADKVGNFLLLLTSILSSPEVAFQQWQK